MGGAVVEAGGTAMNDDDLLFSVDDLEGYKRGEQPEGWLAGQRDVLLARMRAQTSELKRVGPSWRFPQVNQAKSGSVKPKP